MGTLVMAVMGCDVEHASRWKQKTRSALFEMVKHDDHAVRTEIQMEPLVEVRQMSGSIG